MTDIPEIYGDRKCKWCAGLCHTGSWRTRSGRRRRYWCSEPCVRQHFPYLGRHRRLEEVSWLEQVNVISK